MELVREGGVFTHAVNVNHEVLVVLPLFLWPVPSV